DAVDDLIEHEVVRVDPVRTGRVRRLRRAEVIRAVDPPVGLDPGLLDGVAAGAVIEGLHERVVGAALGDADQREALPLAVGERRRVEGGRQRTPRRRFLLLLLLLARLVVLLILLALTVPVLLAVAV